MGIFRIGNFSNWEFRIGNFSKWEFFELGISNWEFRIGKISNWHGLVQFIHRDIPKILINSHLVITLS